MRMNQFRTLDSGAPDAVFSHAACTQIAGHVEERRNAFFGDAVERLLKSPDRIGSG